MKPYLGVARHDLHSFCVMTLAEARNYIPVRTELEEAAMPADVTKTPVPAAITTPPSVKAEIGTLEFTDGYPTVETAAKVRDYLDHARRRDVHEHHPGRVALRHTEGVTLYDNQTRSMLQTPQRYPRAGSQEYPSPAAEADADGSTVVYFSPTRPDGVAPGNWIQTDPERGWFTILRCYSPLQPFFDKTWRAGEIEPVT
jgi:hypothetical protein